MARWYDQTLQRQRERAEIEREATRLLARDRARQRRSASDVRRSAPGHPPDIMPAVFVVHLAFADPMVAMMNGVCERCARTGSNWHARSLQLLRQVFPDAYRVCPSPTEN
jgi:hypothetical protein